MEVSEATEWFRNALTRRRRLRSRMIAVSLVLACVSTAFASEARVGLIGFIEIPAVFGEIDPHGPPGQSQPSTQANIPLWREPSKNSPVVKRISRPGAVVSHEFGYEEYAAAVYERFGEWTRVALTGDADSEFGWIAPEYSGAFHRLEAHGLSYLTEHWDRRLYESPLGAPMPGLEQAALGSQPAIQVVEVSGSGRNAWLLVELLRESQCVSQGEREVVAQGWIKLHDPDDNPTAWFYPRGC